MREAAAMVDRKFDQHRREQARLAEPYVSDLDDAKIKHIGKAYYASILKEDDDQRQSGFREEEERADPTPLSQLVNPGIFQNQIMPALHTLAELESEFEDWVQHVEQNEKTLSTQSTQFCAIIRKIKNSSENVQISYGPKTGIRGWRSPYPIPGSS